MGSESLQADGVRDGRTPSWCVQDRRVEELFGVGKSFPTSGVRREVLRGEKNVFPRQTTNCADLKECGGEQVNVSNLMEFIGKQAVTITV